MRSAIALPMPREEPVMTATWPSSEKSEDTVCSFQPDKLKHRACMLPIGGEP
jgi:hypothetical protein